MSKREMIQAIERRQRMTARPQVRRPMIRDPNSNITERDCSPCGQFEGGLSRFTSEHRMFGNQIRMPFSRFSSSSSMDFRRLNMGVPNMSMFKKE